MSNVNYNSIFKDCLKGTLWEGQTLYQLYSKAYTPWEWHKELKDYANSKGLDLFSLIYYIHD